jgi:hypothetical protein
VTYLFIAFWVSVGVLLGAAIWIPTTIREAERRFEERQRLAARYR